MDKKKRVVVPRLPDELIVLILLRLPVKSLLRFKCVSKSFFSLISDNQFAISHFNLAASPTRRLLCLLAGTTFASRCIDLDDDSSSLALIPRFLPPSCTPEIKGSCNGFILLSYRSPHQHHNLYIWNPSTGAHKKLPLSPKASSDPNKHLPILYGFGYDASTNDYLVFLGYFKLNVQRVMKANYELFSLRANAWKTSESEVEGNSSYYCLCITNGILLNGVLHWLAYRRDIDTITTAILAFDLMEKKSFSVLPLPQPVVDFHKTFGAHSDLCVLDGYLCMYLSRNNATEIWVMNEYKVSSSWKKFAELCNAKNEQRHYFSPICSTKCGDIVGLNGRLNGGSSVVKFNAKGQLLEHHSFRADRREAIMYTESLLSFPS